MDIYTKLLDRLYETKRTPVGVLHPDLLHEHKRLKSAEGNLSEKIKARMVQLQEETKQQLEYEFGELIDLAVQDRKQLWQKTKKEMQLPDIPEQRYILNHKTGTLYQFEDGKPGEYE